MGSATIDEDDAVDPLDLLEDCDGDGVPRVARGASRSPSTCSIIPTATRTPAMAPWTTTVSGAGACASGVSIWVR
jgi:hypothetical protein